MQVEMIELYRAGTKLPKEQWRHQRRYKGELCVSKYFAWWGTDRAPACASLQPLGQVEDLHKVRILYLRGRNLVLMGNQSIAGVTFEQMWWCRIIGASCELTSK